VSILDILATRRSGWEDVGSEVPPLKDLKGLKGERLTEIKDQVRIDIQDMFNHHGKTTAESLGFSWGAAVAPVWPAMALPHVLWFHRASGFSV